MSGVRSALTAGGLALAALLVGCAGLLPGVGEGNPSPPTPTARGTDLVAARKAAGIADCPASSDAAVVPGGLPDLTLACLDSLAAQQHDAAADITTYVMDCGAITPAQALLTEVVKDCSFTNRKGEAVDPRVDYRRLTHRQYDWLRDQVVKATLDEVVDPEA